MTLILNSQRNDDRVNRKGTDSRQRTKTSRPRTVRLGTNTRAYRRRANLGGHNELLNARINNKDRRRGQDRVNRRRHRSVLRTRQSTLPRQGEHIRTTGHFGKGTLLLIHIIFLLLFSRGRSSLVRTTVDGELW